MISRREGLKWLTAAMAVMPAMTAVAQAKDVTEPTATPVVPLDPVAPWPDVTVPQVTGPGYGTDPDLMNPAASWPLILSPEARELVAILSDLILPRDDTSPGAGEAGADAFIDEWVSSPYPGQQGDRDLILHGLAWLDAQAAAMGSSTLAAAPAETRMRILDSLIVRRYQGPLDMPTAFFERLRVLIIVGFYTAPEGRAALGYLGNTPVIGAYPGPTDEAMAHFHGLLDSLGLKDPGKPWEAVKA